MEDMKVDSLENGSAFTSPLKLKDLDNHSFLTPRYSGNPFRSKRLGLGLEAPAMLEASGLSPYRNKGDRVRAIHLLARDLSQRLEREMEKLQIKIRPVDLKDQRWSSETPALSEIPQKAFGLTVNPSAQWDPRRSLDLPAQIQKCRERIFLEGGSELQIAKERLRPFLSTPNTDHDIFRWPSSLEEHQSTVDTEGCAVKEGSQKERNTSPEEPRAKLSMPSFPLYSGRIPLGLSASSLDDIQVAPHHNMEVEKDITKKHPGLQLGHCANILHQDQTHNQTSAAEEETGDKSEPVDSTSQWSELSQFYGCSSTFRRFGLTMVEQHLREEELRARHQSALLRLREKALHEKARAELAWLEHEKSCQDSLQDSSAASATAEKQSALLTRLKQEQAEIHHLQNICRAAHQERKLLLKQQKDLLLVQQTTSQLWKQLHEQLEKSLQQVHGTQKESTKSPLHISSIATGFESSRDRSRSNPQQGVDTNNLHTESGEVLSQAVKELEEFPKEKQQPRDQEAETKDIITAKDSHFSREQPIGSAITSRGCKGSGDNFVSQKKEEQDTGSIKYSKEVPFGSSMNEGPQCLVSTISPATLYSFSPFMENSQSDAEFHKARAILINISGSSLSSLEEAEDAQDTDVSLPEEFIFQDELQDDRYGGVFHDTLTVPQIAIDTSLSSGKRGHTQMSEDHSDRDDLPATYSQGKTLEGTSASERKDRSDSMILSTDGSPSPKSLSKGGSHSGQKNTTTIGRDATSLKDSEPRAETMDKMAFQGDAEPVAVLSCSGICFDSPKDQKKQGLTEASSTTEGDGNDENPSCSKAKDESMTLEPKSCLEDADSLNDGSELLTGEMQLFPSQNSSKPLLVLDSGSGCVEHSVGEGQSLDEVPTAQLLKVSMSDDEIGVGSLRPQSIEETVNGNQNGSTMDSQSTKESGMATHHSSSPKAGEFFSPKNQDDTALSSNGHLPGVEDEILSPVDEVLSYESSDLLSSTNKDVSFQSEDLPAPPEDLSEKGSNFSLQDFPSPPEQFVFPETGELQYATEEDASIKTNDLPSLSDDLRSE
ncbi:coiled-coil domain-containing protein 187 [Sceloporus undulatus]|uniref:coiled-coil domain-containing protein 187 n=1 Tax=Sceloporus undulatus TaxID=8520 RepID=UPI001C4B31ED|nr:coiled-coil domain-containing protein 187 [Sceloporus undulatus]